MTPPWTTGFIGWQPEDDGEAARLYYVVNGVSGVTAEPGLQDQYTRVFPQQPTDPEARRVQAGDPFIITAYGNSVAEITDPDAQVMTIDVPTPEYPHLHFTVAHGILTQDHIDNGVQIDVQTHGTALLSTFLPGIYTRFGERVERPLYFIRPYLIAGGATPDDRHQSAVNGAMIWRDNPENRRDQIGGQVQVWGVVRPDGGYSNFSVPEFQGYGWEWGPASEDIALDTTFEGYRYGAGGAPYVFIWNPGASSPNSGSPIPTNGGDWVYGMLYLPTAQHPSLISPNNPDGYGELHLLSMIPTIA